MGGREYGKKGKFQVLAAVKVERKFQRARRHECGGAGHPRPARSRLITTSSCISCAAARMRSHAIFQTSHSTFWLLMHVFTHGCQPISTTVRFGGHGSRTSRSAPSDQASLPRLQDTAQALILGEHPCSRSRPGAIHSGQ